jgi:hypothetical protein
MGFNNPLLTPYAVFINNWFIMQLLCPLWQVQSNTQINKIGNDSWSSEKLSFQVQCNTCCPLWQVQTLNFSHDETGWTFPKVWDQMKTSFIVSNKPAPFERVPEGDNSRGSRCNMTDWRVSSPKHQQNRSQIQTRNWIHRAIENLADAESWETGKD